MQALFKVKNKAHSYYYYPVCTEYGGAHNNSHMASVFIVHNDKNMRWHMGTYAIEYNVIVS